MPKRSELARRDPEARRQAILEAAVGVFVSQGFAAARLDEVAKKAGVAKGTIYLHFKDKQDLFEQMVRAAVSPVIERLEASDRTVPRMLEVLRAAGAQSFYGDDGRTALGPDGAFHPLR